MNRDDVLQPIRGGVIREALTIFRLRLECVDAAARSDWLRAEKREVADVGAAIDERITRPQHPAEHARGVELVQAESHAAVGIRAEVETEAQAVRSLKERDAIVARMKTAGQPGQAVTAAAGRRDAAVRAEQHVYTARRERTSHQKHSIGR